MNQLEWLTRYILNLKVIILCRYFENASLEKSQFEEKSLNAVVTDPPYYDAIAYTFDISEFFYVWIKRTLGTLYPLNFATPQTPKTDECTALKHHQQ